jgi:ATP/maltotriose-dependent transcriptional regulator MalT
MARRTGAFRPGEVKLAHPIARPGAVAMKAVIAALCARRSAVVSVVARAGYGKTTLLA